MALKIASVNLLALENSKAHKTYKFENVHLNPPTAVFRRGQEFEFEVIFSNRPYDANVDKLKVLFYYDDEVVPEERIQVPKGGSWITDSPDILEDMELWSLRVISNKDKTLKLGMRTPIRVAVGGWKMTIKCDLRTHLATETYEHPDVFYVLLNPWNKADDVYMPDTQLLEEYVMNDCGKVFTSSKTYQYGRPWIFGQFEAHVLPILSKFLKKSRLNYKEKGMAYRLCKIAFHTRYIVRGNWSGNYEGGTPPTAWTGSAPILKQFAETGRSVKFGQCWIFAAVGCSLCRALGFPTRVVTNVVSAMDVNASLTSDTYFDKYGYILGNSEKTWTFHVWTDVWMARPDLPSGFGGWQAVDPQGGGPASVEAIKRGEIGQEKDVAHFISTVNADIVHWVEDVEAVLGYRRMTTKTDAIGLFMLTKKPFIYDPVGERDRDNVLDQYKYPEGSKEERLALYRAAYKCGGVACQSFDIKEETEVEVEFALNDVETVFIGKNFSIVLDMENTVNEKRTVEIAISVLSLQYNGVRGDTVKRVCNTLELAPKSKKQYKIEVTADDYVGKLKEFGVLKTYVMATVKETTQMWSDEDEFIITKPNLTVEVGGPLAVGKQGKVLFKLKNPLNRPLTDCEITFDCPGLITYQKLPTRNISAGEDMKFEANVTPKAAGKLSLVARFHCKEIQDIHGATLIEVS